MFDILSVGFVFQNLVLFVCFSVVHFQVVNTVPPGTKQCLLWGLASDGTIGANREAVSMLFVSRIIDRSILDLSHLNCSDLITNGTDLNAQAYFMFDAKKSGGVTFSHLRFGPERIRYIMFFRSNHFGLSFW